MKQHILVTGGQGSLGQRLVPQLVSTGHSVRISSRRPRPARFDDQIEWAQAALESPDGWVDAVQGVDTIVHLASAAFSRGVDVAGTQRLLAAATQAGVQHIVYISIVGVDKRDWFYYQAKHECEQLIVESGLPYTILRATQFHEFAHLLLRDMFLRYPLGFLPKGWQIQPIDGGEVAAMLFDAVQQGPAGRLPDAGGPEIFSFQELAQIWMAANGRRRIVTVPFPFLMGRAFGSGHNLAPDNGCGQITWREWVAKQTAT